MPAVYDKMGIHFLYPDNWTLDESDALSGERSVSVYSPGGSFWTIVLHAPSADPNDLVLEALKALKLEYEGVEAEEVSEQIGAQAMSGYDLHFFCLDFTNSALIRGFRTADASCLVLCQAEDREFETVGPVFRAITTSLVGK